MTVITDGRAAAAAPATGRRAYILRCPACGKRYQDDGVRLECDQPHAPALLSTEYPVRAFQPAAEPGLFRYRNWLPVARILPATPTSVSFPAEHLGRELGLARLWVAFSGYWPERKAELETGSFKELEAWTVAARLPELPPVPVVASAGNTAAAFLRVFSQQGQPCVVIVPERALAGLRSASPLSRSVRVVAVEGEYADAIELADALAARPGFHPEGGTRNVARRDGLGTALLAAAEAIGRLPDHYVQAVGSGAGAIAAHEAAGRLLDAGFPEAENGSSTGRPRLLLCQNREFAPMHDAWQAGQSTLPAEHALRGTPADAYAQELTTRRPAWSVLGGIRQALRQSEGALSVCGRDEAVAAQQLFLRTEGIDIEPAAGVALACLQRAVEQGRVRREATVLLHITGGGRHRHATEHRLVPVRPVLRFTAEQLRQGPDAAADAVADAYGHGPARSGTGPSDRWR
ncbi:cysteate synthase [Peterkaempfera sp. SMS 1(5)a]|uniref:cysteate synthase n=1 Tax=Peterkaempfera podocarpi TaxID=3232308 RepID=UPI00366C5B41